MLIQTDMAQPFIQIKNIYSIHFVLTVLSLYPTGSNLIIFHSLLSSTTMISVMRKNCSCHLSVSTSTKLVVTPNSTRMVLSVPSILTRSDM